MGLHHMVTLWAHLGMYLLGMLEVPMVVDILHDWGDMTLAFSKMLSELNKKFSTVLAVSFMFNNCVWFYTRLWCFPIIIYQIILDPIGEELPGIAERVPFVKFYFVYT